MNPLELKARLEEETGFKISMRINPTSSSMYGYISFIPRKTKDGYPDFDFDYVRALSKEMPGTEYNPNFCAIGRISIYYGSEAYNYKKTKSSSKNQVENITPQNKEEENIIVKKCAKCGGDTKNNRKKFCSDTCKYWFNVIKKDNESHLPHAKKRNKNYFSMVVGSEWASKGKGQGKRSGGMIKGGMAARINVTVEEMAEVNKENLDRHFKGITGYTPSSVRLGDGTYISKENIYKQLGNQP